MDCKQICHNIRYNHIYEDEDGNPVDGYAKGHRIVSSEPYCTVYQNEKMKRNGDEVVPLAKCKADDYAETIVFYYDGKMMV